MLVLFYQFFPASSRPESLVDLRLAQNASIKATHGLLIATILTLIFLPALYVIWYRVPVEPEPVPAIVTV